MKQVLFSLSGVFRQEGFDADAESCIDLEDLEGTNCYCSPEAEPQIRRAISAIPPRTACWIDTGDYHYLSYFRGTFIGEPYELILLDNHSDDFPYEGDLNCGNWVRALKTEPLCKETLTIRTPGPCNFLRKNPEIPVFLSIDLDILRKEDFATNWDQGTMRFEELIQIIDGIAAQRRILAVDICGGITQAKGATGKDLALNLTQRLKLQARLEQI